MVSKWCWRSPLLVNALTKASHRIDAAAQTAELSAAHHSVLSWLTETWWGAPEYSHSEVLTVRVSHAYTYVCAGITQMFVWLTLTRAQVTLVHQWSVNTEQLSVAALLRAYPERQLWHFPQAERFWLLCCRRDASSLAAGTDLGHALHLSLQKMMFDAADTWRFWFLFTKAHRNPLCSEVW